MPPAALAVARNARKVWMSPAGKKASAAPARIVGAAPPGAG